MRFDVFHTQEYRPIRLTFPALAEGNTQWLGDGFYFWQDYDIAKWWGKRKAKNPYRQFSIFKATLECKDEDFIDTVFNENDYRNFVAQIEKFAKLYFEQNNKKPTLAEFNDFIEDHKLWEGIKIIRFQDVPANDSLVEVVNFHYKKRIQLRVNDAEIIVNFRHHGDFLSL